MIPIAILIGAAIFGFGLVAKFWKEILSWLKRSYEKLKSIVNGVIKGSKIFIRKLYEGYQELAKYYSKNRLGQWEETVVTRRVNENEVPEDIREMAETGRETDITEEMEYALEN